MENAASTMGLISPTFSPLTSECYNHCDKSIFVIKDKQLYSMPAIVNKLNVQHDEKHGETTMNLMEKILRGIAGLKMMRPKSFSVKDLHEFMPIVNFVKEDMQPDLCIVHNGHAVLFAEEDSHQCTYTDRCIRKACFYANFHCRYLATCNVESPGYCIHFPSAHSIAKDKKSFAAIISCTWSYEEFRFVYSAQDLDLSNLEQSIVDVVNNIIALQFQNSRDVATLYYLFKLDLSKVNRTTFLSSNGWTCTSQCLSGNSIVLKVTDRGGEQQVLKFVNFSVFGNLLQIKQQDSTSCPHLLHFDRFLRGPNSKVSLFTYKVCNPPLTEVEAKECLCNFSHLLISALQAVHNVGIEHCDIRLENICFDPTNNNRIVFIDLDRAVDRNMLGKDGFDTFLMYAEKSCMFSNLQVPSVDFVQLGYMVLWITHFNETVNGFQFSGNSNYHNMHLFAGLDNEPELVKSLIRSGEVPNILGSDLPGRSQLFDVLLQRRRRL